MSGGIAGNANLRLVPDVGGSVNPADILVEIAQDDGKDVPIVDDKDNILRIEHPDGRITVSLDGKPLGLASNEPEKPLEWFDNLAEKIDSTELTRITEDLLIGVSDDLTSRKDWIEDRAQGIKLLGLKIELPPTQGAADGAPVEGMSKVRHPLLLEAVLRFQANARSELLPTDGPVKIRNDSNEPTTEEDQAATALETDMNHYLTAVATEYYPDTDRMLFQTGFGGAGFKKIYRCPLRNRPVSESVDADDLIVNNSATDLSNAQRITHRSMMRPSVVRRLQLLGVYRDISLSTPVPVQDDPLQAEERAQQGITVNSMVRPEDREREIYEIYCELDIKGFEYKKGGKIADLPVPYVVTIDKSSRECLSVIRNYGEKDDPLPIARKRFVMYPFVPGLGFYPIGLLHILGNTTNAVTAAWREMLDSGMFANFPGFLIEDSAGRQNTNIFRVAPGSGAPIKTNGKPIKESVMNLPYSAAGLPALMSLVENMVDTGRRVGGSSEVEVGEGRADVPVGTVMAMIEQAIKVMNAVHKRMHAAQAEEFQILKQLFSEDPTSLICRGQSSKYNWTEDKLRSALDNHDLVPQADPNTSSSSQRIMKVWAVVQLSQQYQTLYDPIKINTKALAAIGWANPEEFFVPPQARANPPPQVLEMQANMKNAAEATAAKTTEANARATEANAKAAEIDAKKEAGAYAPKEPKEAAPTQGGQEPETSLDLATAQAKLMDAVTRKRDLDLKEKTARVEDANRDQDRDAKQLDTALGLAKELLQEPTGGDGTTADGKPKRKRKAPATAGDVAKKTTGIINQIDNGIPDK